METTRTRAEHVRWCKQRAREYLQQGNTAEAVTSMLSDLGKHPETERLAGAMAMLGLFTIGRSPGEAQDFIEGFAE